MENKYIVSLNRAILSSKVGHKASRLAEMLNNQYPVPNGFVVTVQSFKIFCKHNKLLKSIESASFKGLSEAIINGKMPPNIQAMIEKSVATLPYDTFAVRSSSLGEDNEDYSMAGQYDTFLNTPELAVCETIKQCWASLFSEAVIAYVENNNMALSSDMGVIVQQQIKAKFAGVMFTMDPMTKSTDHLIIEWVAGLGDKLVSGEVTPERLYINRVSAVIPPNLPEILQQGFEELVSYALKAEKQFEYPLDIEWCIDHTGLLILQARPITGLTGDNIFIWTNVNMAENFPLTLTPFTWSFVDTYYVYFIKNILRLFGSTEKQLNDVKGIVNNLTGIHGSRIYYNLSNFYEVVYFFPIGKSLKKLLDNFIGQNIAFNFKPSTTNKLNSKVRFFWLRLLKVYLMANIYINKYEKIFFHQRNKWRKIPYDQLALEKLVVILDDIFMNVLDKHNKNGIADILAMIFMGVLNFLTKKWLSESKENTELLAAKFLQGVDIKSTTPAKLIGILSQKIQATEKLQTLLLKKRYTELEKSLNQEQKTLFDEFMFNFGGRCYNDCMIVSPTFEERHDLFWDLVEKYQRQAHATTTKKETTHNIVKQLSFFRKIIFWFILKNTQRAIRLRERGRLIRSLVHGEVRQIVLAIGKQLTAKGHLKHYEDVFYLQWREIEALVYGKFQFPETLYNLISQRKRTQKEHEKNEPPSFFVREKARYYGFNDEPKTSYDDSLILKGVGVSGGSMVGNARIILDPVKDNRLEPGDILITKTTDPGWTPLFKIAGGLILERGGMLSHGAIVAREFGIPAIVGLEGISSRIEDGTKLRINGDTGVIEIL